MERRKKIYRMKIFSWYFYFSRAHLNVLYAHQLGRSRLARRMRELRNRRFKQTKGRCELCGAEYTIKEFQMHHIFPFGKFPQWKRKAWNVVMLCPHCHYIVHNDLTMQTRMMEKAARRRGLNLRRECHNAAERMWKEFKNKEPMVKNLSKF